MVMVIVIVTIIVKTKTYIWCLKEKNIKYYEIKVINFNIIFSLEW